MEKRNRNQQHYMTAAQAQTLLNAIKNLDVVKKHDAQNVPYTITLLPATVRAKMKARWWCLRKRR